MAQDPARMQREIEETRAELAGTIDAIAEKVSPKRVAKRGGDAAKVKAGEARVKATEVAGEAKVRAGAVAGQLKGRTLEVRHAIEERVSSRRAPGSPDGSAPLAVGSSGATAAIGGVSAVEASPDGSAPEAPPGGARGVHRLTSTGLTARLQALGGDGGPPPEALGTAGAGVALLVVLLLGRALRRRRTRRRTLVDLLPLGD